MKIQFLSKGDEFSFKHDMSKVNRLLSRCEEKELIVFEILSKSGRALLQSHCRFDNEVVKVG